MESEPEQVSDDREYNTPMDEAERTATNASSLTETSTIMATVASDSREFDRYGVHTDVRERAGETVVLSWVSDDSRRALTRDSPGPRRFDIGHGERIKNERNITN